MKKMFFFLLLIIVITQAQLSDIQKKLILDAFNTARATTVVPAANMRILNWDDDIAAEMQAYTDQSCTFDWVWQEFNDPPAYFLYRDKATDPVGVARWRTLRMAPYYDYYTGECIDTPQSRKICRLPSIYTAVVFAGNERIGCGTTRCGPGAKNVHHTCAVAPTWDYEYDASPYAWIEGEPCTKCPAGFDYCVRGLCSRDPGPPPSASPTRSPKASTPTRSPRSRSPTPRYTGPTKSPRYSAPSRSPQFSKPSNSPIILPTKAPIVSRPTNSPIILPTKAPVTQRPTKSPSKYRPTISPSVSQSPTPPTARKGRKKRKGL